MGFRLLTPGGSGGLESTGTYSDLRRVPRNRGLILESWLRRTCRRIGPMLTTAVCFALWAFAVPLLGQQVQRGVANRDTPTISERDQGVSSRTAADIPVTQRGSRIT